MAFALGLVVTIPQVAPASVSGATVELSRSVGPPTTKTDLTGTGFGITEVVDITIDTRLLAKATTDGAGVFSKTVKVPRSALPGDHTLTATGETSLLSASVVFTVRTDWPMFHFSLDRRGNNPYENVLGPENVASLGVKWQAQATDVVGGSPAVAGGAVYVGDYDGQFYSFDAATGALRWTVDLNVFQISSSPAVWKGMVFVGSDLDGKVFALDATTGATIWVKQTGAGVFESPAVAGGRVFIGSNDGYLYALDALTGDTLWTAFIQGIPGSPAVSGGLVYVGGVDGKLRAFDALTGTKIWATTLSGFPHTAAISEGIVYTGTSNGAPATNKIFALDASTGDIHWSYLVGRYVVVAPALDNGMVYVGAVDGRFLALDALTGELAWSATADDAIGSSAAVANGVVYVGSKDHSVYAFDAFDGTVLWSYVSGGFVGSSPAVADGVVYVGSFDHYLYAFGLPS